MADQGNRVRRVREIIARLSDRAIEDLDDSDTLGEDLGMDSHDAIDVALELEDALGIEFEDDELDAITPAMTVGDVVRKVDAA